MGPEIVLAWLIATVFVAGRSATDFVSVLKGETPPSLVRGGRAFELASQWQANRKAKHAEPAGDQAGARPTKRHHLWELWCAIWRDRWIDAKAAHDRRVELRRQRHDKLWADEQEWSFVLRWTRSTLRRLAARYDAAWERLAKRYSRSSDTDPGTGSDRDAEPKANDEPAPRDDQEPKKPDPQEAETAPDAAPRVEQEPERRTTEPTDPNPPPAAAPPIANGDAVNGQLSNETTHERSSEMPNPIGGSHPTKAGVLALVSRLQNGVALRRDGSVARAGGAGETAGLDARLAFVRENSGELFARMNEFLLFANDLAQAEYGPLTQTKAILTAEKLAEAKGLVAELEILLAQAANVRDLYASYGWEPGSKQDLMT